MRRERQNGEEGHLSVRQAGRQSRLDAREAALGACCGVGCFVLSRSVDVRGGILTDGSLENATWTLYMRIFL